MYEAYLYFKGMAPYQGALAPKRDTAAFAGGVYASPALASCARGYVIFIASGSPQGSENGSALTLLRAAGGDASPLAYPTSVVKSTVQANWMDECARFMRTADVSGREGVQGIVTDTITVTDASNDSLFPNFMRAVANQGGDLRVRPGPWPSPRMRLPARSIRWRQARPASPKQRGRSRSRPARR